MAVPHLRPAERPPLLAVAVPAFGIYGEASNRKLPVSRNTFNIESYLRLIEPLIQDLKLKGFYKISWYVRLFFPFGYLNRSEIEPKT